MICWLQVTSGRGPEECRWVVYQLVEYLIRETSRLGMSGELIEAIPGNFSQTFKSVLIALEGGEQITDFVFSWCGTVQWIGKSMFRPSYKRKNWFVSIDVFEPIITQQWDMKDVRIERMRSSGPGGQHANKNETAIRVTHIRTGISAFSQEERSLLLNQKLALARLSKLIQQKNDMTITQLEHARWSRHNLLERGNASHVFEGIHFKLKR